MERTDPKSRAKRSAQSRMYHCLIHRNGPARGDGVLPNAGRLRRSFRPMRAGLLAGRVRRGGRGAASGDGSRGAAASSTGNMLRSFGPFSGNVIAWGRACGLGSPVVSVGGRVRSCVFRLLANAPAEGRGAGEAVRKVDSSGSSAPRPVGDIECRFRGDCGSWPGLRTVGKRSVLREKRCRTPRTGKMPGAGLPVRGVSAAVRGR